MLNRRPLTISHLPARPINSVGCAGLLRNRGVAATGNSAWEVAQLPFYASWRAVSRFYSIFGTLLCRIADLNIGTISMLAGIDLARFGAAESAWPLVRVRRAILVTLVSCILYAMFSAWFDVTVHVAQAYRIAKSVSPVISTGLWPLLQWAVVPGLALLLAYYPLISTTETRQ